jgi:hypothetical protein
MICNNLESTKNTNPDISVEVAGIGCCSPRGDELNRVAKMEFTFLLDHIKDYPSNEQIFILDSLSTDIASFLLDHDA